MHEVKMAMVAQWSERLVVAQEVCGFESRPSPLTRASPNGWAPAFQAGYVGSIPIALLTSLSLSG